MKYLMSNKKVYNIFLVICFHVNKRDAPMVRYKCFKSINKKTYKGEFNV